jgi:hypothetical protein
VRWWLSPRRGDGASGVAKFPVRTGASMVGVDEKATGVAREAMACFGCRRLARKEGNGGRAPAVQFWLEQREREQGVLAIAVSCGGGERGGPGVGGARSGSRYGRPNSGGRGRLPAMWNRGSEGERGVAGML